jgi:hypothetical protein
MPRDPRFNRGRTRNDKERSKVGASLFSERRCFAIPSLRANDMDANRNETDPVVPIDVVAE